MKRLSYSLACVLISCMSAFPQATSLTVDCQNPGWLSSMINYGDQQTLRDLKVTGYINGTDIQFIYDLNARSLTGVIDLEDASMVKGGILYTNGTQRTIDKDNTMPSSLFYDQKQRIRKFIYPKTLVALPMIARFKAGVDTLVWTSLDVKGLSLDLETLGGYNAKYISIPEGIEEIVNQGGGGSSTPTQMNLPRTIKQITRNTCGAIIYSFIDDPQLVTAQHEDYYMDGVGTGHYSYYAAFDYSIIYIPRGTLEKYLQSDFAKMKGLKKENFTPSEYYKENLNKGRLCTSNHNVLIEYYDLDKVEVKSPVKLYKGESAPLDVSIYPDANLVSWVKYETDAPDIINIDDTGTIVANDYGLANIMVTPHLFIDGLETKTGVCQIQVLAHVEGVDVPSSMALHINEEKSLKALTLPYEITDNELTFVSSNPLIAEVSETGVIHGLSKGVCTITATSVDGGYTAECLVTVMQPVEALTMEKHSHSIKVGESETLFAQVFPANADDKTLTWISRNDEVASVDVNGNITAHKAGETWIVAVSQDNALVADSCKVTVLQPVTGITLNYTSYEMNVIGDSFNLEATVLPEDASNQNLKWTSTNETVCIVSQGQVIAVGNGTCVIVANTEDGGYIAICTVTVTPATGVSMINADCTGKYKVFDMNGAQRSYIQRGLNIIQMSDGTKKKILMK